MTAPKKGLEFVHKSFLTPGNKPARMRVTSVRKGLVYYTYATEKDNKGAWFLDRDVWIERYG